MYPCTQVHDCPFSGGTGLEHRALTVAEQALGTGLARCPLLVYYFHQQEQVGERESRIKEQFSQNLSADRLVVVAGKCEWGPAGLVLLGRWRAAWD